MESIIIKNVETECIGSIMVEEAAFNKATDKWLYSMLCKRLIDEAKQELSKRFNDPKYDYAIINLTPSKLETLMTATTSKMEENACVIYSTDTIVLYVSAVEDGRGVSLCVAKFEIG